MFDKPRDMFFECVLSDFFNRTCDQSLSAQAETGGATCVASLMAPSGGHKQ